MFYTSASFLGTKCPKALNCGLHLVPPYVPTRRGLAGEQLHTGQIAHKGHDFFTGLVWFLL